MDKNLEQTLLAVLSILVVGVFAFNTYLSFQLNGALSGLALGSSLNSSISVGATPAAASGNATLSTANLIETVIPRGIPAVYGSELGVSFEQPVQSLAILAPLDDSIQLSGDNLQRYIKIATKISCEYCCGADSIIFNTGEAACGCQHSYAMRGLAKYILTKHGSEFSDEQVLEELGKWKTMFFPKQILQKASLLAVNNIELNYINLASNKFRDVSKLKEVAATSGSGLDSIPDMVGGC